MNQSPSKSLHSKKPSNQVLQQTNE